MIKVQKSGISSSANTSSSCSVVASVWLSGSSVWTLVALAEVRAELPVSDGVQWVLSGLWAHSAGLLNTPTCIST